MTRLAKTIHQPADTLADYEAVITERRAAILRSAERKAAYLKPTPELKGSLFSPRDLLEARMSEIDVAFKRACRGKV